MSGLDSVITVTSHKGEQRKKLSKSEWRLNTGFTANQNYRCSTNP